MTIATILSLGETALKLGLICSLTVLALFLSYSMLNVCDLSTDGCFTLGAAVGAAVAVSGHPFLSIFAAMAAGICSGFVTAILQTKPEHIHSFPTRRSSDLFLQELSLIRLFIL